MKKLVFFVAVVAAVSFASCSGKKAETEAPAQDSSAVVEEVAAPADSAATVDSSAVVAQ
jgi:hypothetical protein